MAELSKRQRLAFMLIGIKNRTKSAIKKGEMVRPSNGMPVPVFRATVQRPINEMTKSARKKFARAMMSFGKKKATA